MGGRGVRELQTSFLPGCGRGCRARGRGPSGREGEGAHWPGARSEEARGEGCGGGAPGGREQVTSGAGGGGTSGPPRAVAGGGLGQEGLGVAPAGRPARLGKGRFLERWPREPSFHPSAWPWRVEVEPLRRVDVPSLPPECFQCTPLGLFSGREGTSGFVSSARGRPEGGDLAPSPFYSKADLPDCCGDLWRVRLRGSLVHTVACLPEVNSS